MSVRVRRTTTLAGPNRLALIGATGGLVTLASAGTAVLVLTGTSAVAPPAALAPPLPATAPLTQAPGVVVVPTPTADGHHRSGVSRARRHAGTPTPAVLPAALPFAAPVVSVTVAPAVLAAGPVTAPIPRLVQPSPNLLPALRRAAGDGESPQRPEQHPVKGHRKHHGPDAHAGRHLAKGHAEHAHAEHAHAEHAHAEHAHAEHEHAEHAEHAEHEHAEHPTVPSRHDEDG